MKRRIRPVLWFANWRLLAVPTLAALAAHDAASRGLQAETARRLALTARRELALYVHGYNNTFKDAALTMGELCHFLGREFACGIFTWPAGSPAR